MTFLLLSDNICHEDVIESRKEQTRGGNFPEVPVKGGRWSTRSLWAGLGLGLTIGWLAAAISLWWPDGFSRQRTANVPDTASEALVQDREEPAKRHAVSVDRGQPATVEPSPEQTTLPTFSLDEHGQPLAGQPRNENTASQRQGSVR